MLRSLYSGVSAIKVNQAKLDVIANNIANVGTTAFKSSRVRFKDMISQSVTESAAPGTNQGGVNLKQVGQGVQISGIDTMVGQGMMQPTSRKLDVAMDGEGYLMVAKGAIPADNAGGVSLDADSKISNSNGMGMFYTRDGALTLDNAGNLLNSD
ncbi:MAG: flagellar hook-basal body complex protein, partial [Clostridiaceae bacterium]|nr:flagellar hook-basal body complex protein [Clostridiaceae bacterium]